MDKELRRLEREDVHQLVATLSRLQSLPTYERERLFTKAHFLIIADTIKVCLDTRAESLRPGILMVAMNLAMVFEACHPKFKKQSFLKRCGYK